jgi:hypothetical protein
MIGLYFGVFAGGTAGHANTNSYGIRAFSFGGPNTLTTGESVSLDILHAWQFSTLGGYGNISTEDLYGVRIKSGQLFSGSVTATNMYQLYVEAPYYGTNKYQVYLTGNGDGSGIWLDSNERIWSNGSVICMGADGDTTNYLEVGNNGDLKFNGSAGFYPVRLSQSSQPTPDTGEMVIWRDTDDSKTYLVYNDTDEGVRKVELT